MIDELIEELKGIDYKIDNGNNKNDHYVQKKYLSKFTIKSDPIRIWVKDIVNNKIYPASIQDVAKEKKYYDINLLKHKEEVEVHKLDVDQTALDKYLANFENITIADEFITSSVEIHYQNIENIIQEVLQFKLLNNPYIHVGMSERDAISFYMTYQYLRTEAILAKLIRAIENNHTSESIGYDIAVGMPSQTRKLLQTKLLFHEDLVKGISKLINNGKWTFLYNNTAVDFLTSDNPICVIQSEFKSIFSNVLSIVYPLSNKVCLVINEKKEIDDFLSDNKVELSEIEQVFKINKLIISNAHKYIYSSTEFS